MKIQLYTRDKNVYKLFCGAFRKHLYNISYWNNGFRFDNNNVRYKNEGYDTNGIC